jgi:hypothetical protein
MPDEQQTKLARWLIGGMIYSEARERCASEFGIKFVSEKPLSNFWRVVCMPSVLRRRANSAKTAAEIAKEAGKTKAEFEAATIDQLQQRAFELMLLPKANPREVALLLSLALKVRDQDRTDQALAQANKKLQFEMRKYRDEQAKTKAVMNEPKMTAEEKQQRIRQILGTE